MSPLPSRRAVLASVTIASISGCIDNSGESIRESNNTENQTAPEEEPSGDDSEDCSGPLQAAERYGGADAVEETVAADEIKDPADDCTTVASEIIIEKINKGTEIGEITPRDRWISSHVSDARITVVIWSETDSDGDPVTCPPAGYQFSDVVASAPQKITITIESGSDEESFTCSRNVVIEQRRTNLD